MTKPQHHMLCLGVLADLHRKHNNLGSETWLEDVDLIVIQQAVESAEKLLKMPVSVERLRKGLPIATD